MWWGWWWGMVDGRRVYWICVFGFTFFGFIVLDLRLWSSSGSKGSCRRGTGVFFLLWEYVVGGPFFLGGSAGEVTVRDMGWVCAGYVVRRC